LRGWKRGGQYMKCHLEDFVGTPTVIGLALVGRRLVYGTVIGNTKYDVRLRTSQDEEPEFHKHDVKFFFDAGRKKHVLKQIGWGDKERVMESNHLRRIRNRTDIKAFVLQRMQEEKRTVQWLSVEGDRIRGRVAWFGRFEVILETGKGLRIIAMRHAVLSVG